MAHYDSLTGLPNRTLFFRTLESAVALAPEQLKGLEQALEKATQRNVVLDPVMVDAYGAQMPLNQVSNVNTPDARTIITAGLAIRAREKIRVRQPLPRARVALSVSMDLREQIGAVAQELNVPLVDLHATSVATPTD